MEQLTLVFSEMSAAIIESAIKNIDIEYFDVNKFEHTTIKSCQGDMYIICNALDDYARQIDKAVAERGLTAYATAVFEHHAERCRKISNNLAQQMGYDKEKVIRKCLRQRERAQSNSDIGQDGLSAWANKNSRKDDRDVSNIATETDAQELPTLPLE